MHSSGFFRIKPIARLILKREISGSHTISDQSLLLSTNVLNDTYIRTYVTGFAKSDQIVTRNEIQFIASLALHQSH